MRGREDTDMRGEVDKMRGQQSSLKEAMKASQEGMAYVLAQKPPWQEASSKFDKEKLSEILKIVCLEEEFKNQLDRNNILIDTTIYEYNENIIKDNIIYHYPRSGKKITSEQIATLTNLAEDYSVSELVDNCLAKNKKKTINILNENNFSQDETILIIRVFLNKSKKIFNLSEEFSKNRNIDLTIAKAKPPIFWKDKNITKQQIIHWTPNEIKKLMFKISEIELQMKKNLNNSINLITNFILELSASKTSN